MLRCVKKLRVDQHCFRKICFLIQGKGVGKIIEKSPLGVEKRAKSRIENFGIKNKDNDKQKLMKKEFLKSCKRKFFSLKEINLLKSQENEKKHEREFNKKNHIFTNPFLKEFIETVANFQERKFKNGRWMGADFLTEAQILEFQEKKDLQFSIFDEKICWIVKNQVFNIENVDFPVYSKQFKSILPKGDLKMIKKEKVKNQTIYKFKMKVLSVIIKNRLLKKLELIKNGIIFNKREELKQPFLLSSLSTKNLRKNVKYNFEFEVNESRICNQMVPIENESINQVFEIHVPSKAIELVEDLPEITKSPVDFITLNNYQEKSEFNFKELILQSENKSIIQKNLSIEQALVSQFIDQKSLENLSNQNSKEILKMEFDIHLKYDFPIKQTLNLKQFSKLLKTEYLNFEKKEMLNICETNFERNLNFGNFKSFDSLVLNNYQTAEKQYSEFKEASRGRQFMRIFLPLKVETFLNNKKVYENDYITECKSETDCFKGFDSDDRAQLKQLNEQNLTELENKYLNFSKPVFTSNFWFRKKGKSFGDIQKIMEKNAWIREYAKCYDKKLFAESFKKKEIIFGEIWTRLSEYQKTAISIFKSTEVNLNNYIMRDQNKLKI